MAPTGQLSMLKLELSIPNPDKPEITNYKHYLILKLAKLIPNLNIKISNKIKNQLFGVLNFGDCD
jgi:hypothetical protein